MKTTGVCLNCDEFYITYYPDHFAREVCRKADIDITHMQVCPLTGKINMKGQVKLQLFGVDT